MITLQGLTEQIKGYSDQIVSTTRRRVLGANNERLDLLVDTFFKLAPQQRNLVLAGGTLVIGLFFMGGVGLYFAQIRSLSIDLNKLKEVIDEVTKEFQKKRNEMNAAL